MEDVPTPHEFLWITAETRERWRVAVRAWRSELVRRAPEATDYGALADRVWRALGRPSSPITSPPSPEAARAEVIEGLRRFWAEALGGAKG